MAHEAPAPTAAPATLEGRLAGWATTCPCGLEMRNTVRTNLLADMREHAAYWAAKDAPKARKARKASPAPCTGCAQCDPAEAARDEAAWADWA